MNELRFDATETTFEAEVNASSQSFTAKIRKDNDQSFAADFREVSELKGEKGDKGESVCVSAVVESPLNGGENTVYFSDGMTLTVKNGTQGVPGEKGERGADGISPIFSSEPFEGGRIITIHGANTLEIPVYDGEKGDKGDKGDKGEKGDKGDKGADGVMTFADLTAEQKASLKGEKGDKGDKGDPGVSGSNGVSVTHSWSGTTLVVTSAAGTSAANLKGEKGDKGDQGIPGVQGVPGDKGDKGEQGIQGEHGIDGSPGLSVYQASVRPTKLSDFVYTLGIANVATHDRDIQIGDFILYTSELYKVGDLSSTIVKLTLVENLRGAAGEKGDKGDKGDPGNPGIKGDPGDPGVWTRSEAPPDDSYTVWIDPNGTIDPGTGGGTGGADGFSPTIKVQEITGGHSVSVTDANGTQTFNVMDGAKGDKGDQGVQGMPGQSGMPASHYWNGTTLTITSASGTSSADLKGGYYKPVVDYTGTNQIRIIWSAVGSGMPSVSNTTLTLPTGPQGNPGKDGKTPVKGEDYFTAAEKAEMVNEVLAALPVYNGEVAEV